MRSTLSIDDDILAIAKQIAHVKHIAIGAAVSELARRGLEQRALYSADHGFPVFSVSETTPRFGLEEVQSAEDES